ncbi:hypothetical protein C8R32_11615 [Nitrosospira sp. Nsp5]|uniref:DUF4280 domain-containing protein n=1 Tax=Nitrosospira multiformis TaxID=1231 RepID=A0ABY0TCK6_9PROT|nr:MULTISPECIES: hypothetical protein [Nitrosospira]PTR05769.1 hypothetical protein C8R32_11615 [Nitrosospira sp. Nsp5]SDQ62506.1 hypothetical protein SAMN05216402_1598 [Nitrosospira multiformis]
MASALLHVGATVQCSHGGTATATLPNSRVLVGNQPTVTMSAPYTVAGCSHTIGTSPSPCVTAQWTLAAQRVTSNGLALVLMDSQATCTPNGTPLMQVQAQRRVTAS